MNARKGDLFGDSSSSTRNITGKLFKVKTLVFVVVSIRNYCLPDLGILVIPDSDPYLAVCF
jgi:hypothetical protein